jgi:MFS family permease
VSSVLGVACGTMFAFHQPLALQAGISRVGDFLVAYTLTAVLLRLLTGGVVDRIGPRRVAFASFVFYGAVVAAMGGLGRASGSSGLIAFGVLFGAAHGLFWPSFMAVCLNATTPARHAEMLAWVNATFNGGTIAVAFLGVLAKHGGFVPVFALVGLLTASAALLLREPRPVAVVA